MAVDSLDEAIELTNASPYGLLAAIFTGDLGAGMRFADSVKTGWVNINDSSNYWESHLPFGGRSGTDSGIGARIGAGASLVVAACRQAATLKSDRAVAPASTDSSPASGYTARYGARHQANPAGRIRGARALSMISETMISPSTYRAR